MARYILIDKNSGYIWGDSADLNGKLFSGSAIEFAQALDESIDPSEAAQRRYTEVWKLDPVDSGYLIYRADINGSEAVPMVENGQDEATIEEVQNQCEYKGAIRIDAIAA